MYWNDSIWCLISMINGTLQKLKKFFIYYIKKDIYSYMSIVYYYSYIIIIIYACIYAYICFVL